MRDYFIRRLLLVPITMLGVTLLVFLITRAAPGGPMEKAMMQMQMASEGGGSSGKQQGGGVDEATIEDYEEEYGYDKPVMIGYLQWLGVWPRERWISKGEFYQRGEDTLASPLITDEEKQTTVVLKGIGREVFVEKNDKEVEKAIFTDTRKEVSDAGWKVRIENEADRQRRWLRRNQTPAWMFWKEDLALDPPNYSPRAVVYKTRFSGILQGDLGKSTAFGEPVWELIKQRIPVALYFGILTTILTYAVCLPLGIVKALKHRTFIDNASSILIFMGYAIPGFALGGLLMTFLAARQGWFPMFGLDDPALAHLPWYSEERLLDRARHTVLPLLSYLVGSFAYMTMMMKNNLMDNLAADYVRTAVAKGVNFRRAVFRHALRNSIIPVATTLGQLVTILVSGSILIEKVFDIQGFGLLQLQALEAPDIPVIMGTLTIAAFLLVIGNILSDLIVAMIDPRVKFK
ncbi:MAG: ABC transporter permease [Verrucomicrobiota bacterium JB023]|nr:ABC transporter permease [Verrucomicrobiota bacterium JB023]